MTIKCGLIMNLIRELKNNPSINLVLILQITSTISIIFNIPLVRQVLSYISITFIPGYLILKKLDVKFNDVYLLL